MRSIEEICNRNINLVYMVVNKIHSKFDREDLISAGMLGLFYGAKTYDKEKGYTEATYITRCIRNEINKYMTLENTNKRKVYYEQVSINTIIGDDTELLELMQSDYDLETEFITKDRFNRIIEIAKDFLSDIEYKSLIEVEVYGRTLRETAKLLNVSYQTIYDAKERAINKLRYKLAREK